MTLINNFIRNHILRIEYDEYFNPSSKIFKQIFIYGYLYNWKQIVLNVYNKNNLNLAINISMKLYEIAHEWNKYTYSGIIDVISSIF